LPSFTHRNTKRADPIGGSPNLAGTVRNILARAVVCANFGGAPCSSKYRAYGVGKRRAFAVLSRLLFAE
jgi:hypothetical protein